MFDRLATWWRRRGEGDKGTADERITAQVAGKHMDPLLGGTEGGSIPQNYLPTGIDEGRPKK